MKQSVKTKGSAQLFEHPILEAMTKASILESTLTSVGIAICCIWIGWKLDSSVTSGKVATWFFIGLISWSLFEYVLHRYLFHLSERAFKGAERLTYLLHGVHHEYPNDAQRIMMPFAPKVIFSVVFFAIFFLIFWEKGPFFSAGFLMGYYVYSTMHYSIHRFKAPKMLKNLWTHLLLHHHLHDDKAFGVSSILWDKIFDTMPPKYNKQPKVAETHSSEPKHDKDVAAL
jgi:sterol desaturase/sphingolipid hydroxylase (fatty acid hydroxylase superfamily)